jgi:hypothetical protein
MIRRRDLAWGRRLLLRWQQRDEACRSQLGDTVRHFVQAADEDSRHRFLDGTVERVTAQPWPRAPLLTVGSRSFTGPSLARSRLVQVQADLLCEAASAPPRGIP